MPSNPDEIIITEEQFFDYTYCPAMYYFKHIRKMNFPKRITISDILNQTATYFFSILLGGRFPTAKEVQRKWDSLCIENKGQLVQSKIVSGWDRMLLFMQWAEKNQIMVGDVHTPYSIDVKNVTLRGNIDQILVNPVLHKVELFYPHFSTKFFNQVKVESGTKYTIDAYAFKTVFNGEISGIHIYDPKRDKAVYTYRTEQDYAKLRTNIYSIGNAIKHGLFYTRESVFCEHCPANKLCKYFCLDLNEK